MHEYEDSSIGQTNVLSHLTREYDEHKKQFILYKYEQKSHF